jgi:hypothetical protein
VIVELHGGPRADMIADMPDHVTRWEVMRAPRFGSVLLDESANISAVPMASMRTGIYERIGFNEQTMRFIFTWRGWQRR